MIIFSVCGALFPFEIDPYFFPCSDSAGADFLGTPPIVIEQRQSGKSAPRFVRWGREKIRMSDTEQSAFLFGLMAFHNQPLSKLTITPHHNQPI